MPVAGGSKGTLVFTVAYAASGAFFPDSRPTLSYDSDATSAITHDHASGTQERGKSALSETFGSEVPSALAVKGQTCIRALHHTFGQTPNLDIHGTNKSPLAQTFQRYLGPRILKVDIDQEAIGTRCNQAPN